MTNRTTALFFILLANIILLTHAVVPHYHHKSKICFVNFHTQTDCDEHKHSDIKHEHKHDGKNEKENCILKEVVAIPSNRILKDYKNFVWHDHHQKFDGFQAVLFCNELIAFVPIVKSNTFVPLISSSYINFVNISLSLRAPPTV
jgi:hypothetical protein